jgi:hypothetical protein
MTIIVIIFNMAAEAGFCYSFGSSNLCSIDNSSVFHFRHVILKVGTHEGIIRMWYRERNCLPCIIWPEAEVVCVAIKHFHMIVWIITDDPFVWRLIYPLSSLVVVHRRLWIARREAQNCSHSYWKPFFRFIHHFLLLLIDIYPLPPHKLIM